MVRGDDEVAVVRRSVVAKYGWPARVSLVVDPVARLLHIRRAPRAGIRLAVETAPVSVRDASG